MEMNFENWETPAPLPDMEKELKRIRRDLRRRSWKIVLTSLLCAAAIVFASVQYAIPALEKRYWDPNTSTYVEGVPDIKIAMDVYTELFCPGYRIKSFDIEKEGFANYSLDVGFQKVKDFDYILRYSFDSYRSASVSKDELSIPSSFWEYNFGGMLEAPDGITTVSEYNQTVPVLKQLPEYMNILAYVHFTDKLVPNQINKLIHNQNDTIREKAAFLWFNIYNDGMNPACGFSPTATYLFSSEYFEWEKVNAFTYNVYQAPIFDKDSEYPHLFLGDYGATAKMLEDHVTSLLRCSQDQVSKGTGIIPNTESGADYYQQILDYIAENGITSSGAYVIATPQALLELLEEDTISFIKVHNAWISFS